MAGGREELLPRIIHYRSSAIPTVLRRPQDCASCPRFAPHGPPPASFGMFAPSDVTARRRPRSSMNTITVRRWVMAQSQYRPNPAAMPVHMLHSYGPFGAGRDDSPDAAQKKDNSWVSVHGLGICSLVIRRADSEAMPLQKASSWLCFASFQVMMKFA